MEQSSVQTTSEYKRLTTDGDAWRHWGPYLSERAWGTVREDYSPDGSAWDYFTHDAARSRAYRVRTVLASARVIRPAGQVS